MPLLAPVCRFAMLVYLACSRGPTPEQRSKLLDVITNKQTTEKALVQAIQQLGPPTEPARLWSDIANSDGYPTWQRRHAVLQLFCRHVRKGMLLPEVGKILDGAKWLKDNDTPEFLGGLHPPLEVGKPDDRCRAIMVLPDPGEDAPVWNVYLVWEGADMDNATFRKLLRGDAVEPPYSQARLKDIWYLPGLCILYSTDTWGVEQGKRQQQYLGFQKIPGSYQWRYPWRK